MLTSLSNVSKTFLEESERVMADRFSEAQRYYVMSRIPSKDTKPEKLVRSLLHKQGLRFRIHSKKLPGKPDIVLPKYKTCIFVHGCFWHRHMGCSRTTIPKTRKSFWEAKFESNVQRDRENQRKLKELGWQVEIIWECELSKSNVSTCMDELVVRIGSRRDFPISGY